MSTNPDRPQFRHIPTGHIVFPEGYTFDELELLPKRYWEAEDVEAAVRAIKAEAARKIEEISPWWRQNNDIRNPTPEGKARFAAIDAIRAQSNAAEAAIRNRT